MPPDSTPILVCGRCGYDLRTIALDSVCPECGQSIALTIRQAEMRGADYWAVLIGSALIGFGYILSAVASSGEMIDGPHDYDLTVVMFELVRIVTLCCIVAGVVFLSGSRLAGPKWLRLAARMTWTLVLIAGTILLLNRICQWYFRLWEVLDAELRSAVITIAIALMTLGWFWMIWMQIRIAGKLVFRFAQLLLVATMFCWMAAMLVACVKYSSSDMKYTSLFRWLGTPHLVLTIVGASMLLVSTLWLAGCCAIRLRRRRRAAESAADAVSSPA